MRKLSIRTTILLAIFSMIFLLFACQDNSVSGTSEKKLSSISVVESSIPVDAVKGSVDVTQIQILLTYDNGTRESITIDESMLTEASREKLNEVGTHMLTVVYQNKTAKFQMAVHDVTTVYYTLRVYGGVPTYINKEKIVNTIELSGEYYEERFPEGTVVTIQWVSDGNNFAYWMANDINVGTSSIIDVVVDGDLVYRPYSTAFVSTVSFTTFTSTPMQSKTTNVLYESDISRIYRDNYFFAGWTTDKITEAQSLNGYDKNRVSFPYSVTRDVTFYAVWVPMGVMYTKVGDHYEVSGYEGSFSVLELPSLYQGLPVTAIRKDAFSGKSGKSLTKVVLPSSIERVEDGAFAACLHLQTIETDSDNDSFYSEDGVLYTADKTRLIAYPANRIAAEYVVASETQKVGDGAFRNALVGSVVLSSRVEWLGKDVFDSPHIDHVDFSEVSPVTLTSTGSLFHENLASLLVAESGRERYAVIFSAVKDKIVTSSSDTNRVFIYTYRDSTETIEFLYRIIENRHFVSQSTASANTNGAYVAEIIGCGRQTTKASFPNRFNPDGTGDYYLTSIADRAFAGCDLISEVFFPYSIRLEHIGEDVFADTLWIKTIENNSIIANNVLFKYLGSASTYTMDPKIYKIAEGAFKNNTSLKYVNIGESASLRYISSYAFYGCSSFIGFICDANPQGDGLYLKFAVESIGNYAFCGTAITGVTIQPSAVQQASLFSSIGEYAFSDCRYLRSVMLVRATTDVSTTAFVGCISLEKFVLNEENAVFKVFDGILYSYSSSGEYTLYAYPAARMDGEFDPTNVRLYGTDLTFNLSGFINKDTVSVGTIRLNGAETPVYLTVCAQTWSVQHDLVTDKYTLVNGNMQPLRPSTSVRRTVENTFVADGDYYFSLLNNTVRTPLLYDETNDAYYYYPKTVKNVAISVNLSAINGEYDPMEVGKVTVDRNMFSLFLQVKEGIGYEKGLVDSDPVPVRSDTGEKLKQTTIAVYNDDGTVSKENIDGDFYYFFYSDADRTKKIVLLYDVATGTYHIETGLNVKTIGEYAFSYSSIAAIKIPALLSKIEDHAITVPGLSYIKFDVSPAQYSYDKIVDRYMPNVVLSENVIYSDVMLFFGGNSTLADDMRIEQTPYTFLYDDNDRTILYGMEKVNENLHVIRVSRLASDVIVPETVSYENTVLTQVKRVAPYAFYGVYLQAATLRGVGSLASFAFSEATNMTSLYIETDFISDIQSDSFGESFHNGLYIYDDQNGFNLYRDSNWIPSSDLIFTYYDSDDMEYNGCPYLILNEEQLPIAVITYVFVDGEGHETVKTSRILTGVVTVADVKAVQDAIARPGYDISGWENERGDLISVVSDYVVPYNQILSCVWSEQEYDVYFVISKDDNMTMQGVADGDGTIISVAKQTSGTVTYAGKVTYLQPYTFNFVGYDSLRTKFEAWQDENKENRFASTGTWTTVLQDRCIYLYPVMTPVKYAIVYYVDETDPTTTITVYETEGEIAYGASDFRLNALSDPSLAYSFLGWYILPEACSEETLYESAENVTVLSCDDNVFAVIRASEGDVSGLTEEKAQNVLESSIVSLDMLSALFGDFIANYTARDTEIKWVLTDENENYTKYAKFYNKAQECAAQANGVLSDGFPTDLDSSAVIGFNKPYEIVLTDNDYVYADYMKVISRLFGFDSVDSFRLNVNRLMEIFRANSAKASANSIAGRLKYTGSVYTENGTFVLPYVWQNQTETLFAYVFFDTEGKASIWLSDVDTAFEMADFEDTGATSALTLLGRCRLYGKRVYLTDKDGFARLTWLFCDREEYTLYPLWSSVIRYTSDRVSESSVSLDYGKTFRLAVPVGAPTGRVFDGWYILDANGEQVMITDEDGVGLFEWTFDGKQEYDVYTKWRRDDE